MKNESMILMIRAKKSGNIIGLKEDIAMRLAGVMDIERIDVAEDAAAVVHGKWKDQYQGMYANQLYKCSVCGETAFHDDERWFLTNFCQNCGAKMDGE